MVSVCTEGLICFLFIDFLTCCCFRFLPGELAVVVFLLLLREELFFLLLSAFFGCWFRLRVKVDL